MPQYELMYLLGSHVTDTDVPQIAEQVKKTVADFGGSDIVETSLGKKKLAYAIKKTKNGHYAVVNFTMPGPKLSELDAKIRTMDGTIIRYIMVNLDEHMERLAKDKVVQSKMTRRDPVAMAAAEAVASGRVPKPAAPAVEIDQAELDKKIEEALTEDITK